MIKGFDINGTQVRLDIAKELLFASGTLGDYPYPIAMGIIQNIEKERAPGIHVTQITDCPRRAYLKTKVDEFPTLESSYWMFRGTLAHAVIEAIQEPGSIVEQTFSRATNGTSIVGTPDRIVPSRKELSDWKTAKRVTPKYLPYGEHAKQVNIYRWLVEPEYEIDTLLITYMDMAVCHTIEVEVEDVSEYVCTRTEYLNSCLVDSITPDAETGWQCGYCAFVDRCPEGKESERKRRTKSY